jgi:hypothetical protein
MSDDFQAVEAEIVKPDVVQDNTSLQRQSTPDIIKFRQQLVEEYHKGSPSLAERLKKAGKEDLESIVVALLDEMINETDHLLGNELVAAHNGELRDSSIISFKRLEGLVMASKQAQSKQQFEKQVGGIDVDSPSMMVIFRFFLSKAKDTFARMDVDTEIKDLFFRVFGDVTENWKKELRDNFDALKNPKV